MFQLDQRPELTIDKGFSVMSYSFFVYWATADAWIADWGMEKQTELQNSHTNRPRSSEPGKWQDVSELCHSAIA